MSTQSSSSVRRRAIPILAGFLAVVMTTTVTDILMHATGIFPRWGERMTDALFVVPLAYRIMYAVLGGYIAARLAADRPVSHAVVLGVIGSIVSAIGTVATIGQSATYGPAWYSLLVTATAIPGSLAGGQLFATVARWHGRAISGAR